MATDRIDPWPVAPVGPVGASGGGGATQNDGSIVSAVICGVDVRKLF